VLIEEYGVLKLYRRLRDGVSPEVEMALHLTERTEFRNTPPLLGTIEWHHRGKEGAAVEETTALGVLFAFVRNQGEAWSQALDYLTRYLDEANLAPPDPATPVSDFTGPIPDTHAIYFTLATILGKRTAELHRALAAPSDDPAFAPEPVTEADIASWRQEAQNLAASVLDRLAQGRGALPEAARAMADRLLALRDAVPARFAELLPDRIDAQKTRFHGDYHLGQVLAVQNDYFIIDFEGEPLRAIAERRRKMSPLKDVAGMLRSFDYCAASAVRQLAEIRPQTLPTLERHAAAWRRNAAAAFMDGYRTAIAGCPSIPADASVARRILDFFKLEKAIYEVGYELANRPAWLPIPLAGVLQIIDPEPEELTHAAAD
jgi:maltose alpha-D-glucosyltransferase/alpha-amylase